MRNKPLDQQFGENLVFCRKKHRPGPCYKVAPELDMSPQSLKRREDGDTAITLSDGWVMSERWGVSFSQLCSELGEGIA